MPGRIPTATGSLTPTELNAAVSGMVQAAAQASFQAADKDSNGSLSQAEFDQMIIEPARTVFRIIDANGDGQISQQESQSAQRTVSRQIRMLNVPEPANSLSNQIENATQRGGAPVDRLAHDPEPDHAERPRSRVGRHPPRPPLRPRLRLSNGRGSNDRPGSPPRTRMTGRLNP